jgi:hypothetical protein
MIGSATIDDAFFENVHYTFSPDLSVPPRQTRRHRTQAADMKKIFSLEVPGHQAPRVIEAIKSNVRKYVKRERRKPLPEGVDFWDFDCKIGQDEAAPEVKHVEELIPAIDQAAADKCDSIYIEILAKPGHRKSKSGNSEPSGDIAPGDG